MAGAYETKQYRNVFAEYGYSEQEIEKEYRKHLRRFSWQRRGALLP